MEIIMFDFRIKSFIVLVFVLTGCSSLTLDSNKDKKTEIPNEMKINEKCEAEIHQVKIFQVLENNGALAFNCHKTKDYCTDMVVAIPPSREMLWDDKKIHPPKDQCFVIKGTYKYVTKNDSDRTVPVVGFDYKYPPSSMEELFERMELELVQVNHRCVGESANDSELIKVDHKKLCDCYVDSLRSFIKDSIEREEKFNTEESIDLLIEQSEKKCGYSLKNKKWFR